MTLPGRPSATEGETLGELFTRLMADGKRLVRAEIAFYKQLAVARLAGVKTAVVLFFVALFLVQASLTTLLIGIGIGIARLLTAIGTAGGIIAAAVIGLVVSGLLVRTAVSRFAAIAKGLTP